MWTPDWSTHFKSNELKKNWNTSSYNSCGTRETISCSQISFSPQSLDVYVHRPRRTPAV